MGDFCSFDFVFGSCWDLLCLYWWKIEDDWWVFNGGLEDVDSFGCSFYFCVVLDGGVDIGLVGGDVY